MLRVLAALIAFLALAGAARAAPPLEAYGQLPGLEMAALSPSGDRYAVVGSVGYDRRLVIVQDGKPVMTSPVGDQKVRRVAWAGEDIVLVWTSSSVSMGPTADLQKYEVTQVVVLNLKTGKSFWPLTVGRAGNGVQGSYGITQENGRWYAYFGGVTMERAKYGDELYVGDTHPDLYRIDLETGEEHLVGRESGRRVAKSWVIGPDGGYVATVQFNTRTGDWRMREGRRGADIVKGVDPMGQVWLSGKGRTEGTIIYGYRDKDGEDLWFETSLAPGGVAEPLFRGQRVIQEFRDRRTGLLIGYVSDADRPKTRFFDSEQQKRMEAAERAFPGQNVKLEAWNDAFDRLIVRADGPQDAGTWWLVDIRTGKAEEIGRPYPMVRAADVAPVRMVSWTAPDGKTIEGVLTLPPGREAKALPVVVLVHGGPWMRDYPQFEWWPQALASRGYAVFQPNYRGSEGYGAAFRDAGDAQWGRAMQTDISSGLADLVRQGIVDGGRACIAGGSYGGFAALAGVTLQQGLYRCAVSVAGPADLPTQMSYWRTAYGGGSPLVRFWEVKMGPFSTLGEVSPLRHAARADAPILLIHGKDDTLVPPDQSSRMAKALREAEKPYEHIELKGEDHWLSRGDTRLQMLKAMVAFVEKHNPPG